MRGLIFLVLSVFLSISCSSHKGSTQKNCDENEVFKIKFFESIKKVEDDINGNGEPEDFEKGLDFIDNYTKVSYDKMLNYTNSYTTMKDFEKDKKIWLKWYEENKCSNLQFK